MRNFQWFLWVLSLLILESCATYNLQVEAFSETAYPLDKSIEHSFYLLGDAGNSEFGSVSQAIQSFEKALDSASSNSTAIILGDNIYEKGWSTKSKESEADAEHKIKVQTEALKDFKGRPIIIPGNHDWYSGLDGLKAQEKFVEDALGKNTFLPENGCPIERINISDDIVLIIVDSQWYITKWDKYPKINDKCEFKTRDRFIDEFEGEVKKARGKTTIIAIHHPMFTNGPHGGQYSFGSHMSPIPILGTLKNLVRKLGGVSNADLNNARYRELKKLLVTIARENDKALFVSGHEHSLQYIVEDRVPQIVSGSGSKKSPTRNVGGGKFSYGQQGYARLDVFDDGSSWVRFYEINKTEPVFTTRVIAANEDAGIDYPESFPDSITTSIYTKEETQKTRSYERYWGKRYREYFGTEVTLPTVHLDTLYGGLKPVRKGGGHQSKSLRFEDNEGREYIMRALRKNPTQYLQSVVFKDQYITPDLEGTDTEGLVADVFTGSHPYAPFTIAELSKAVDVYHTTPRLFYVPKQKTIGKFNDEFGDEIYMIEERAGDGHGDKAGFGYSNKLISTYDLLEELRDDEDNILDEASYLRARLFDMLIGDWDRHQDQWRWARFKENGKTIYRPVPRDRDQAFSLMDDGFLMGTATWLVPSIRLIRSYEAELKNPKWFNLEPYPLDVALLSTTPKEEWITQAKYLQDNITEEVINKAFLNFPEEVRDHTIDTIKSKLLGRKALLTSLAEDYYKVVNKYTTVTGTDKDDYFEIERLSDGRTRVRVYRIIKGKKERLYKDRIFFPDEHKEVWIYGLDDEDYFEVKGLSQRKISLRIIGGQGTDSYNIEQGAGVHVYDYLSRENNFLTNKGHRHLKDDYYTNFYDFKKVKYNSGIIIPLIGYNPDDGFKLGVGANLKMNGFDNQYFSSSHAFNGHIFFATGGFDLNYKGEFSEIFRNTFLGVNGRITSPNFAVNFFGFGNSTPNLSVGDEQQDLDYNRVRKSTYDIAASIIKRGDYGSYFSVGVEFQSIGIENTPGRFINEVLPFDGNPPRDEFISAQLNYRYRNADNLAFPTLGLDFNLTVGYNNNVNNSNDYSYIISWLGAALKLEPRGKFVLASKIGTQFNLGDDYEFYQAATIGANNGLRGYRNERFSGKQSFYQTTDLRWNLKRAVTSIVPIEYGVFLGFDYGRVWVSNDLVEDPGFNKDRLNTSFGGGLFLNLVDTLSANVGLFNSDDSLRFSFGFGFGF
ncbi:metallophosphoesterase [Winogradskyella aurantiaca]|uniref:metallophosphoesterase n=1 Tax=Winogradskyella aurantiaca TaxID=2219558 RepID=UPI000E1D26FA|nr:metallophosphoesterase [Winogradskyella aurantiaca]